MTVHSARTTLLSQVCVELVLLTTKQNPVRYEMFNLAKIVPNLFMTSHRSHSPYPQHKSLHVNNAVDISRSSSQQCGFEKQLN